MRIRREDRDDAGAVSAAPADGEPIVDVRALDVEFRRHDTRTRALRGVDLSLYPGRVLGVAGESGSGKTTTALAAMGLLPHGTQVSGSIRYRGTELLDLRERELRRYRGRHMAMIFQETSTALNPVIRIGRQLMSAARAHSKEDRRSTAVRVRAALDEVRLTDHERVMNSYPHELSGGMCQRVIIAMALSCGSRVLFADEPTTALDVSVQEEILELLRALVLRRSLALMMISHDLAVLNEICDDIAVMYRGEIVETGPVGSVLRTPAHPYTVALLDCLPRLGDERATLPELPSLTRVRSLDDGCRFRDRCIWAVEECATPQSLAAVAGADRFARCWRGEDVLATTSTRGALPGRGARSADHDTLIREPRGHQDA